MSDPYSVTFALALIVGVWFLACMAARVGDALFLIRNELISSRNELTFIKNRLSQEHGEGGNLCHRLGELELALRSLSRRLGKNE